MARALMVAADLVPESVLAAFGLSGPGDRLTGGAGLCVRVGDAVLKPAEDTDETRWTAELLTGLAVDGVRLARPLRARDGRWVAEGWSASRFVAGESQVRLGAGVSSSSRRGPSIPTLVPCSARVFSMGVHIGGRGLTASRGLRGQS